MKKLFSTKYSDNGLQFALLLLRLAFAGIMLTHGWDKLMHFAERSSRFYDPLHIGSALTLALVVFAEFFCAALVLLGFLTRLACVPLIINMGVALYFVHKGQVFGVGEQDALYLGGFLALLFTGPGKISLDRLIGK